MSDTLLILYSLSSSTLTYWCLYLFLLFVCLKILRNIKTLSTIMYLIFLYYFLQLSYNFNVVVTVLNTQLINTTLQNGLLNIHPIYIYNTYIFVVLFWLSSYKWYHTNSTLQNTITNTFTYLCIILSGVYLGAFWASQELNWGGFWSWDPVELVSLFLIFWFLLYFHNNSGRFLNRPFNHVLIAIMIIYFIIRLGVITTIHSFVRMNNNPYLTKIALTLFTILVYMNTYKYYYMFTTRYVKFFVFVFLFMLYYLFANIYYILNLTNSFLSDVVHGYFALTLLVLYYFLTCSKSTMSKKYNSLVFLAVVALLYTYNINIYFVLVYFLFFYKLSTVKDVKVHVTLLFIYVLFFVFFINMPVYNNQTKKHSNVVINNLTNSKILDLYYELSFCLKKQLIVYKNKNLISHVMGFSIHSNIYNNVYIFSKNDNIYSIFVLEIIVVSIMYLVFLCVFGVVNYKYTRRIKKKYAVNY